jgi:glycosyltransferase involved in cell wall biosynthesis
MLGWEFPPFITGGLGTACYGLTKALSRRQTEIMFVLPKTVGGDFPEESHVHLLSHQTPAAATGERTPEAVASTYDYDPPIAEGEAKAFEHVTFKAVPARFSHPYPGGEHYVGEASVIHDPRGAGTPGRSQPSYNKPMGVLQAERMPQSVPGDYGGDLVAESRRYAALCVDLARGQAFDVIHAHDWLTFPAGMAVAAAHGKPLVVHVHSTEFDRSGDHVYQQIYDVERRGMHAAMRVIAVSHLTKSIIEKRYGVEPDMIEVVYNGIENGLPPMAGVPEKITIDKGDKVVLFLGRITMQKGPEVFIAAAKKVLQKYDKVKFIMAGSGDKVRDVIEMAAREGIGHKVTFTGFVRGDDVAKVFKMADVFVMPSVSEPFGLASLEAISHDVPVIMSRTSGASEVLKHTLKVDFWDVDEIANKIIAVLRHPSLGDTLRTNADLELRKLTWDGAAQKCLDIYRSAIASMPT